MTKSALIFRTYFLAPYDNWKRWIAVALIFKSILFLFQLSQGHAHGLAGFIGAWGGDTDSYLTPVDHLIGEGEYSPDYRMPGYAFLYFPLALGFPKAVACNILIILQVFLSSISAYCLALTARNCFQSDTLFYFVFYTFSISCFTSLFDSFLLTESLCTSATVFSVYFFSLFIRRTRTRDLFYSGVFLMWAIYLRPVYAPLPIIFCLVLLYDSLMAKSSATALIKNVFIFVLPLVLIETLWVIRNYETHKRIVVLTPTLYYPEIEGSYIMELMDFVQAFGGDRTWWNPDAEIRWFGLVESQQGRQHPLENKNIHLPQYLYNSSFTPDSLEAIKGYIININNRETPASLRADYTRLVKEKLNRYTLSIRKKNPFLYYVKGPALLLKKFFIHSGTYNLFNKTFSELSVMEKIIKIFYSALYVATIFFCLAGMLLVFIVKKQDVLPVFILGITLYSVILFPCVLRQIEFRYLVPVYPFMTVMACYFVYRSGKFLRVKGLPTKL